MDTMAVKETPKFPKGGELQEIIARANRLRAEQSGRILRRWLGLDRRPHRNSADAPPTAESPMPREG